MTLVALGLTAFGGCNEDIFLGTEAIFWSANSETGDISQWLEGGDAAGGKVLTSDAQLTAVTSPPPHSGRYALGASISTTTSASYARLFRCGQLPQDLYYSIWVLIPARYTVAVYWNLFEFQGRADPAIATAYSLLWSLDLGPPTASGDLPWYLYDSIRGKQLGPATQVVAPIGRWFRIEAFMHQATDSTGRVTFWIDGSLFLDVTGVSTVPSHWLEWAVGSATNDITEKPAEIFIDDAQISRVGPGK